MDVLLGLEAGTSLFLQIGVVVAVAAMARRCVSDPRVNCHLWTVCFLCVITLLIGAIFLPHRRIVPFPALLSRAATAEYVQWQHWLGWLAFGAWCAGVFFQLGKRLYLAVRLMLFLRNHCREIESASLLESHGLVSHAVPDLKILVTERQISPFCWQLHQPLIVLPRHLLSSCSNQDTILRHVLLHELEHLRTQHPLQSFLQGICSTLFWFHPSVWFAARESHLSREYLCDSAVVSQEGSIADYLRSLAHVAEVCQRETMQLSGLGFRSEGSVLMKRCQQLLKHQDASHTRSVIGRKSILFLMVMTTILVHQFWVPTNAMASRRSAWSPWPKWSASVMHQMGVQVRDFEVFEDSVQLHEVMGLSND